jgi:cell wall-associated NlpC family hydrolase
MIRVTLVALFFCIGLAVSSCGLFAHNESLDVTENDSAVVPVIEPEQVIVDSASSPAVELNRVTDRSVSVAHKVSPEEVLAYAKTLIGTPYKYGSVDPAAGLDCSGFITHVFNHFSIQVPRSSIDFTNYGVTVNMADAMPGDLILFTGTDSLSVVVGHMGIVTDVSQPVLRFIHSTSGKAYGVTITELNAHYRKRFVKIIRIPYTTTKM